MLRFIFTLSIVVLLSACGRGHDGGDYYRWIGCHVVTQNPVDCFPGSEKCKIYAFGPGDLKKGDRIYFKQTATRYGPIGKIHTARPCKENE